MAKKATRKRAAADSSGPMQSLGKKLDETPAVKAAEAALRKAKEELAKAEKAYHETRGRAANELKNLAHKNVGEMVDSTLEYVKRHPAQGMIGASLLGFFLGRLFRR